MKERQKRLKAIQSELLQIYSDLFGVDYIRDADINENSEFQTIIERFKQKHFYIRQLQKERQKKQKKNEINIIQQIQKNQKIRQQIKKCKQLLDNASSRIKNGLKNKDVDQIQKILKIRETLLNESYQMLDNINIVQFGDKYEQKRKNLPTLNEFKKKKNKMQADIVDFKQQIALERFEKKDNEIQDLITQVRNINKEIKHDLVGTNRAIDLTAQLIQRNAQKVDKVNVKIKKGTQDLKQVLIHYRKPSKLCLDVCLIFLLLALIGVIINMMKTQAS